MSNPILQNQITLYIVIIWSLIWKGIALWRAARLQQRNWFVAMLLLNTIGLLEIVYLFRFAKHRLTAHEVNTWFKKEKRHHPQI
jgi:hypothetical protein